MPKPLQDFNARLGDEALVWDPIPGSWAQTPRSRQSAQTEFGKTMPNTNTHQWQPSHFPPRRSQSPGPLSEICTIPRIFQVHYEHYEHTFCIKRETGSAGNLALHRLKYPLKEESPPSPLQTPASHWTRGKISTLLRPPLFCVCLKSPHLVSALHLTNSSIHSMGAPPKQPQS